MNEVTLNEVTLADVEAISIGAGVLGTGGGGNTYLGKIWLTRELQMRGGCVRIIRADEVADDDFLCSLSIMAHQPSATKNHRRVKNSSILCGHSSTTRTKKRKRLSSAKSAARMDSCRSLQVCN